MNIMRNLIRATILLLIFILPAGSVQKEEPRELFYNLVVSKDKEILNAIVITTEHLEYDQQNEIFFYRIAVPKETLESLLKEGKQVNAQ